MQHAPCCIIQYDTVGSRWRCSYLSFRSRPQLWTIRCTSLPWMKTSMFLICFNQPCVFRNWFSSLLLRLHYSTNHSRRAIPSLCQTVWKLGPQSKLRQAEIQNLEHWRPSANTFTSFHFTTFLAGASDTSTSKFDLHVHKMGQKFTFAILAAREKQGSTLRFDVACVFHPSSFVCPCFLFALLLAWCVGPSTIWYNPRIAPNM